VLPSTKLIYLVRDPVERIISQYVHRRSRDEENRPISECLEVRKENPYVAYSCYATQIEQYRQYFGDEQLLIVDSQELRCERKRTLDRIFEFLGVQVGHLEEQHIEQESNQTADTTERVGIARSLARVRWIRRTYASIPVSLRNLLKPL
jgi:hypothetical protein